ncbi:uncharacterized protein LOC117338052 [Pecten maximus]|uniref:uncharacterized protein LOC117338052 n=1 Tax=Pecten maximus TaxID=6579 RepID=UPI00145878A9|nr:uncharacterized protein LOC117338052 [Pecten maximus]
MLSTRIVLLIFIGRLSTCTGGLLKINAGTIVIPCSLSAYDADKDGLVTEEEVEKFFLDKDNTEEVSKTWRESFFEQFDLNHDHLVQVEEFYLDKAYQEDCILSALMKG